MAARSKRPVADETGPRPNEPQKPRLLIFIVAYNAEKKIEWVLGRIPRELGEAYEVEVLLIDDCSGDRTFERGHEVKRLGTLPFPLHVLYNPVNQGYGGNQKIGYHFAIEQGFDFVALLHGDGQYAPECLPLLVEPLARGEADAVFGSRMLTAGGARDGGMPLYKYLGNKILTTYENLLLGTRLSEFHSGYRVYSVAALRRIPFHLNTNVFHFDTEIIIQFVFARLRIREVPIPTYYGDEICHVDGLRYAWDVTKATTTAWAQRLNLFYARQFDCGPDAGDNAYYGGKGDFPSPHAETLRRVPSGARVLDLGCAGGYVGRDLKTKGCHVTGVDLHPPVDPDALDDFHRHDLNDPALPVDPADFDVILMLDVVEHLLGPEAFVERLYAGLERSPRTRLLVSTGNVAFGVTRLMLLLGQFNYGKRGILDLTHTRLFTFGSLRRLFEQSGFEVTDMSGIPAPFPLAMGQRRAARVLLSVNGWLIRLWRGLFAYQIYMEARPRPSLAYLLADARAKSETRAVAALSSGGAEAAD